MSKTASPPSALSAPAAGLLRCALVACVLAAHTASAVADPGLRPSEQLDLRRLGKVSETERSVLRVEWRAATTGADEARAVQQMLDSLRRMEDTVSGIGRLLRAIPAQTAVATPAAPEPESDSKGLALAAGVAVLAIFFWLRRRGGSMPAAEQAGPAPAPDVLPTPEDGELPGANADVPMTAPELPAASDVPPEPPTAMPDAQNGEGDRPVPPAATRVAAIAPASAAPAPAAEATTAPPQALAGGDAVRPAAPKADIPPIEFTLEEADPESVARENERVLKLQAASHASAPATHEESHVEPTLELAEIMLSMGLEQSAAQALVEFSEANPRQALYHWLKLLDIYRNSGHRKDFKETAEKLRQHFNIQAEDWTRTRDGTAPTLEDFPRIATHVQEAWAKPEECTAYLRHLLEDNREGSRAGFPQPVAEEILLLIEILNAESDSAQVAAT